MSLIQVPRRRQAKLALAQQLVVAARQQNGAQNSQVSRRRRRTGINPPVAPMVSLGVPAPRRRNRRRNRNGGAGGVSSAPSAWGQGMPGGRPSFGGGEPGVLTITSSEILESPQAVAGLAGFKMPLIPTNLSWLSGVACNFSRYRWDYVRADFVTTSPTSKGGAVAMGAVYDGMEDVPRTMQEMRALAHSQVIPVWSQPGTAACTTQFDPTRWSRPWYSFFGEFDNPDGDDITPAEEMAYIPGYLCYLQQTSDGGGEVLGHVVLTYTITLIDPIPSRMNSANPPTDLTGGARVTRGKGGVLRWLSRTRPGPSVVDNTLRVAHGIEALSAALQRMMSHGDDAPPPPPRDPTPPPVQVEAEDTQAPAQGSEVEESSVEGEEVGNTTVD
nr:MAG: putative coat protein [Barnaviridae sp.]